MAFAIHKSVKSGNVDNLARTMWAWSLIDDRVRVPVSDSALSRMNNEVAHLTDDEIEQKIDETLAAMKGRFAVYLDSEWDSLSFGEAMNAASQTVVETGVFGVDEIKMARIEEQIGMVSLGCEPDLIAEIVNDLQNRLIVIDTAISVDV